MKLTTIFSALLILTGIALFIFGGYDDSPGAQLLGLLVALYGASRLLRQRSNVQAYVAYVRENPNGLWFKERWYGWGWVPVKWQGWATVGAFIAVLILNARALEAHTASDGRVAPGDVAVFGGVLIASVLLLLWVCFRKGSVPIGTGAIHEGGSRCRRQEN